MAVTITLKLDGVQANHPSLPHRRDRRAVLELGNDSVRICPHQHGRQLGLSRCEGLTFTTM